MTRKELHPVLAAQPDLATAMTRFVLECGHLYDSKHEMFTAMLAALREAGWHIEARKDKPEQPDLMPIRVWPFGVPLP